MSSLALNDSGSSITEDVGDKMKTLTQYLAEYLDQEHDENYSFIDSYPDGSVYLDVDNLKTTIEQGIDAYQSTENCTITTMENPLVFVRCGCCGDFHQEDYSGDCQNDADRFTHQDIVGKIAKEKRVIEVRNYDGTLDRLSKG